VTTEPRDPVADLIAIVERGGFIQGRRHPTLASRVRWLLIGVLLGIACTLWWAGAAAQVPPAAEAYRRDLVRASQDVWGMDAPVSLLAAQLHAESAWRPDAVSPVGAQGLAQFMRATAADVARRYGGGPPNPFDPRWAMAAQSRYLRELHGAIAGAANPSERMAFALAGYNGGARHVQRRRALSATPERCFNASCDINPGITAANQRENRVYPRRIILELMPRYHAAGWGGPALHARYLGDAR
jgi:soluble lytic murein transglycosylase-like protein